MSTLEERARECREKRFSWATDNSIVGIGAKVIGRDELDSSLCDFARSEIQRTREECAKAVCEDCANGVPFQMNELSVWHENGCCEAAAIHRLEMPNV